MKSTKIVLSVVCSLLLVVSASSAAYASNWSGFTNKTGCGDLNATYSTNYTVKLVSLLPTTDSAVRWSLNNAVSPTDINMTIISSASTKPSVNVYDANYSSKCGYTWHSSSSAGVVGLAKCEEKTSSGRCRTHSVFIDTSFAVPASTSYRRQLATHELGHTLGLKHRSDDVMQQGYPKPSTKYSTHDKSHINTQY